MKKKNNEEEEVEWGGMLAQLAIKGNIPKIPLSIHRHTF